MQDKKQYQSHLFVPRRDPMKELWNGPRAGTDGALEHTGNAASMFSLILVCKYMGLHI